MASQAAWAEHLTRVFQLTSELGRAHTQGMAKLMLIGPMAHVELTPDNEEGGVIAVCRDHSTSDGRLAPPGNCSWTEHYDTLNDATEYAADHADRG